MFQSEVKYMKKIKKLHVYCRLLAVIVLLLRYPMMNSLLKQARYMFMYMYNAVAYGVVAVDSGEITGTFETPKVAVS